ncbi:MAG: YIP1 family protein [Tannerella sp.]|nr:YIP1 family protein [Tannerella sp.]
MFNDLFNRLAGLIFKPAETWNKLSQGEEEKETFLSRYIYPLLGLIALAAFVGVLFSRKEFSFEIALKSAIKALISNMGGYFLAVYLMRELWRSVFHRHKNTKLWYCFVGYASAMMFALNIILLLLPEFFFLRVAVLYTAYLIWEGATAYMHVEENERLKFSAFASAIIIVTPLAIDSLLFLMMPGLRL